MKLLKFMLGVMTAIGGFVDVGNLVTAGITGARFGMALTWAIVIGTVAMTMYGEMAGRVAAVARRPVFHIIRERLGVRASMLNLVAFGLLSLLTLAAELGGVSLTLEIVTGWNYLVFVPLIAALVWLTVWRMRFTWMENIFGILGLCLIVYVIALFVMPTNWGDLWHSATHPWVPPDQGHPMYWFYAISLFGACLVPYQVIFFSSGGREEHWTDKDLVEMRMNAVVGFPLGGLLSIAIMAAAYVVLQPAQIDVSHLSQTTLPIAQALGPWGLVLALIGFVAAMFAAACECALSIGYAVGQFFGWGWGKDKPPRDKPRFHVVCLLAVIVAAGFIMTSLDPISLTIVSVVLGAAAVPLTYFPVLVVANDRGYMGKRVNRVWNNAVSMMLLVLMVATSLATIPLLLFTKAGQ
jgi:manganese transport protein